MSNSIIKNNKIHKIEGEVVNSLSRRILIMSKYWNIIKKKYIHVILKLRICVLGFWKKVARV